MFKRRNAFLQSHISDYWACVLWFQPSRELAEQTYDQIAKFKKYITNPELSVLLVIGGANIKDQISALNAGVSHQLYWSIQAVQLAYI